MLLHKVDLPDTHAFSSFFLDYIGQKPELKEFYHRFPIPENFKDQLKDKAASFTQQNRDVLVSSLKKQYEKLTITDAVKSNLESLGKSNTFTITTGHQLNIFTGPLYFIYKIVTVINACKKLKALYPDQNFVPVYWMASEDHDYDEIKYFRLYGKKYVWETHQAGAVGRFSPNGLEKLLSEVPGDVLLFKDAYLKNKSLAAAVRHYVNTLFGKEGLIVIDGDDSPLKSLFKKVIHEDLFQHTPKNLVEKTNQKLESLGYKTQVYCREVNFFHLDNQLRARIERNAKGFSVVDSDLSFSEPEINKLIEEHPEKFSPNVILRPLYQEVILPNLAYVGGPAEMVYWLQLKSVFNHFKIPFPVLLPRNFAMVIESSVLKKYEKTGLEFRNLFQDKNELFKSWVLKNTHHDLTLGREIETSNALLGEIRARAEKVDSTLGPLVGAESKRILDSLEKIEKKLLKSEKRHHSEKLRQIESVKDALFPNNGQQERVDNFLNFFQRDPEFIIKLIQHLDPFDFRFNLLCYND